MCNIHLKYVAMLKKKRTQHVVFPSVVHRVTPLRCSLLIRFWTADCLVMIVNVLQNSAYDSNKRDPI